MEKDEALDYYRRTLEINHNDAKVCFACGLGLLRAGAINAGSSVLQRAASLEPLLAKRAQALINEHKNAWLRDADHSQEGEAAVHQAIA